MQATLSYVGIHGGTLSSMPQPLITSYAVLFPKGHQRSLFYEEIQFGRDLPGGKGWALSFNYLRFAKYCFRAALFSTASMPP
jgi:hypothetical protein